MKKPLTVIEAASIILGTFVKQVNEESKTDISNFKISTRNEISPRKGYNSSQTCKCDFVELLKYGCSCGGV